MAIETDAVLVDTRDERVVTQLLSELHGLVVAEPERSSGLGLSKVRLSGIRSAVHGLIHDHAQLASEAVAAEFGGAAPTAVSELDVLLAVVRHWARRSFDGWCPTVDRDHDDSVTLNPHVKIGVQVKLPKAIDPTPEAVVPPGTPDGPRVGIADAQIYAHDDLAGRYVGRPLTGDGPFPSRAPGHATLVAGLVLRRAPNALLVCHPVLKHGESRRSWDVANRLMAFAGDDVDVLNMSFGCLAEGGPPLPMRRAIERLGERTVLVAAVGNHGEDKDPFRPMYPAAFGDVIAVGAAAHDGMLAPRTPNVPWLDLMAPGVDIEGPFLKGTVEPDDPTTTDPVTDYRSGYVRWSGSSLAAATVSGEIARRMTVRGIDAFAARDELLAEAAGDVIPVTFDLTGLGLLSL